MSQLPLEIKLSPTDFPKGDKWREDLLWHLQSTDDMVDYIRKNMLTEPELKSGVILFRDLTKDAFQTLSFRGKKITQPEDADAIVKLKRQTAPKVSLTFNEKTELLEQFVEQEGRLPGKDDVIDGFRVGSFYASIIKSRDKYQDIIEKCGSDKEPEDEEPEEEEEEEVKAPKKRGKK